jgi:hypothetical protein
VSKWYQFSVLAALAFGGVAAGIELQRRGVLGIIQRIVWPPKPIEHIPIPPPRSAQKYTFLVMGQSNVANHGSVKSKAGKGTFAADAKAFYALADPLPGASGQGGSVWPRFAALQKRKNPGKDVVIATVAQGSSSISQWVPGSVHFQKAAQTILFLSEQGCPVDAIIWHQGETESWESAADGGAYAEALGAIIHELRTLPYQGPIFVCQTSRDEHGILNETIRQAQCSLWDPRVKIYAGVDTDTLGAPFRSDGVHFNEEGLSHFAELLTRAVANPSPIPVREKSF